MPTLSGLLATLSCCGPLRRSVLVWEKTGKLRHRLRQKKTADVRFFIYLSVTNYASILVFEL
jgi:hypothetical protein